MLQIQRINLGLQSLCQYSQYDVIGNITRIQVLLLQYGPRYSKDKNSLQQKTKKTVLFHIQMDEFH